MVMKTLETYEMLESMGTGHYKCGYFAGWIHVKPGRVVDDCKSWTVTWSSNLLYHRSSSRLPALHADFLENGGVVDRMVSYGLDESMRHVLAAKEMDKVTKALKKKIHKAWKRHNR